MGTLRSLDRRTIGICVCIAVVAAALAGLAASVLISDDTADRGSAREGLDLVPANQIDGTAILAAPAESLDGQVTDLGTLFVDQPMLVNFWQSTCAPCVEEMPLLDEANDADPGLTVVGVATLDDLDRAIELADETAISYPWVQDPTGMVYLAAEGSGMPTTVLLDETGTVVASRTGPFEDLDDIQSFVADHTG